MTNEFLSPWLIDKIRSGEAILFLGAGASKGASDSNGRGAPTGEELRDALSTQFLGGSLRDKPLAQVAEYAKNESSFVEVQNFIRERFLPLMPAEFHKQIPLFRWHAIITTNYDLVVERAYDEQPGRLQSLAVIIQDSDNFDQKMRSSDAVPYLKLHGCITAVNNEALPLILATEEYARHKKNREHLFRHFQDWAREHPIIFCGYDVSDPNIQQILFDLSDMRLNRPMYALVRPGLTDFDIRYWSGRRFTPIKSTFKDFLANLDAAIPSATRVLAVLRERDKSSIQSWIRSGSPSDVLLMYLDKELEHVRPGMPYQAISAQDFFKGESGSWSPIADGLDIGRRITDDLVIEAALEAPKKGEPRLMAVKGYAGCGKTVTLRRFAWNSANDHGRLVLWLREGGYLKADLIREIYQLTQEPFILVIDDVLRHIKDLESVFGLSKKENLPVTFVCGARSNEWFASTHNLDPFVTLEFELRDLSAREVDELLRKLSERKCLGQLVNLPVEARKDFFNLTSDRQLLVALHEATSGKNLEEILINEYNNLVPSEAKVLYLDICTLHRFRVGVRAGLISRVSGVTFHQFSENLLKPLQHVVHVYYDAASRDYAYRSRHTIISDIVVRQVLNDPEKRADQFIRLIRSMNVDYESDRIAFEQLIRGKELADLFGDRIFADRIFQAAMEGTGTVAHIEHQRAIFELNHPGGSVSRAFTSIGRAIEVNANPSQALLHTKAMILRRMALESGSFLEREKLRADARAILDKQIRRGSKPHSYHTLGQIILDDITDRVSASAAEDDKGVELEDRVLSGLMTEAENVIRDGLQRYPDESYLLSLESEFANLINDKPRTIKVLEKAFGKNPGSDAVALRLSRAYREKGSNDDAMTVLFKCLESNPATKSVRLEIAKNLINKDELANKEDIRRFLRGSFSDGDKNFEAQFWYARHEFLFGDPGVSRKIFRDLSGARIAAEVRSKVRGIVKHRNGDAVVYKGSPKTVTDSFCFVTCPEYGAVVFIYHSEFSSTDWDALTAQSVVSYRLGFTFKGPTGVDASVLKGEM